MKKPIEGGCVLLSRQILESRLWSYSDATLRVAIYLILKANHKQRYFKGVEIKRGQTAMSISRICDECSLSTKAVRYALDKFVKDDFIKKDYPFGAKQGQRLTICKYGTYQDINNYKGNLGAHAGNNEGTPNNNEKKENNEIIPPISPKGELPKGGRNSQITESMREQGIDEAYLEKHRL